MKTSKAKDRKAALARKARELGFDLADVARLAEEVGLSVEDALRRIDLSAILPDPPEDDTSQAKQARQVRNQKSERNRGKRERPPAGHVFDKDGTAEEIGAPKFPVRIRGSKNADGELGELRAIEIDAGPGFWRHPSTLDQWMVGKVSSMLDEARGDRLIINPDRTATREPGGRAPAYRLEQLRRAYQAAFGWPPEHEWQKQLRDAVKDALHIRQGKRKAREGSALALTGGPQIAFNIRMSCPPGTVPGELSGDKIERVLATATLARGGGNARAKRRVNWENAVDDLIRAMGSEPFRPGE